MKLGHLKDSYMSLGFRLQRRWDSSKWLFRCHRTDHLKLKQIDEWADTSGLWKDSKLHSSSFLMSPGAHKQPNRKTQRETFMNLLCPLSCTDRMANIQQNFFHSLTLSLALAPSLCKTWNEKSVSVFKAIFISHFIRKGENFSKPERQSDFKLLFVYLRLLLSCFALKFTHSIRIRLNGCNYRRGGNERE